MLHVNYTSVNNSFKQKKKKERFDKMVKIFASVLSNRLNYVFVNLVTLGTKLHKMPFPVWFQVRVGQNEVVRDLGVKMKQLPWHPERSYLFRGGEKYLHWEFGGFQFVLTHPSFNSSIPCQLLILMISSETRSLHSCVTLVTIINEY